jgi:hypothetical protein
MGQSLPIEMTATRAHVRFALDHLLGERKQRFGGLPIKTGYIGIRRHIASRHIDMPVHWSVILGQPL